jgi:hypothetical protein
MRLPLVLAPFALAACTTTAVPDEPGDGIARAGLNERVYVDGPYVTPLAVVEDSRCPINALCVTAGRTRVMVRIDLGSRSEFLELCSDKPLQVADGQLSLVEVQPGLRAGERPGRDNPYRFGFRFAGGL